MKKRIAIVLPSFDVGGTEKMVTDLVSNIDMSCFQLLVISLAGSRANHLEDIVKRSGAELYFAGKTILRPGLLYFRIGEARRLY